MPGTLDLPGCPLPVDIANGGFETDTLEYWGSPEPSNNVNYSVVSPGYGPGSKYMFQADFHTPPDPSDYSEVNLQRNDYHLCIAYNYTFSFDYRFQGYDYANNPEYCQLVFQTSSCMQFSDHPPESARIYPPKDTWTHVDFGCRATASGENILSFLPVCNSATGIPAYNFTAFSFQLDNVTVKLRPVTEYW
jgi:hypothetical protein